VPHGGFGESGRRVVVGEGDECHVAMRVGKQPLSFENMPVVAYVWPEQMSQRTPCPDIVG
jgi:hypothetical protein